VLAIGVALVNQARFPLTLWVPSFCLFVVLMLDGFKINQLRFLVFVAADLTLFN